jgi:hypothetical protein
MDFAEQMTPWQVTQKGLFRHGIVQGATGLPKHSVHLHFFVPAQQIHIQVHTQPVQGGEPSGLLKQR